MPSPLPSPASLAELLGTEPPPSVQSLPPATRARLADVLAEARAEQSRSLAAAFEAALRVLPFPVRRVVRKVVLG
jgi:hypothetical protein